MGFYSMNWILTSIGILMSLIGCTSQSLSSKWEPESVKGKKVIVFVPGLYGSALSDEDGDRVFQTFGQGLWGTIPLAFEGERFGIEGARRLSASGILDRVSIIPGIYSVDGYGGSVEAIRMGRETQVIPFYYDWRQDCVLAVGKLHQEILKLKEAGVESIALVGHSLGGLLIAYFLRYGSQPAESAQETWEGVNLVDGVVVASSPFRGSLQAFYDLRYGTAVGFAKTPLNALSLGSFATFFQFLPPESSAIYLGIQKEPVYALENWKRWKLGLFSNLMGASELQMKEREVFTQKWLKQGPLFSKMLNAKRGKGPSRKIPMLSMIGKGERTLAKARLNGEQWAFDQFEDGDGLVTLHSAELPAAYSEHLTVEKKSYPMAHRGVFTLKSIQEEAHQFLLSHGF